MSNTRRQTGQCSGRLVTIGEASKSEHGASGWISALVLSCLTVSLLFVWQGTAGFSLWDEGHLWYAVQRVAMHHEIPIRDFLAYDPSRYYWSAALITLLGDDGIVHVRITVAVFQALGLFVALLLIGQSSEGRKTSKVFFLAIATITLAIWMYPRHKLFDVSLSIFLVAALAFLARKPAPRNYVAVGIVVGIVATFGRNHGVYGAVGSLCVLLWLALGPGSPVSFVLGAFLLAVGVAIGFLPIILMVLLVPGFASAFLESIRLLLQQDGTNLPLPVPWPWTVDFTTLSRDDAIRGVMVGLFFIAVLAFGWAGSLWAIVQRIKGRPVPPSFVAAAFVGIPYAQYAYSRADIGHLALSIFPMLVGCFIALSTLAERSKWLLSFLLCSASVWVMIVYHPGWQCIISGQCVDVEISGSVLHVDPATANDIALLRHLSDQYASEGKSFITTPFWPGAYALLNRKSPMREIYALPPRREDFERTEIERIKAASPAIAIVLNLPLDGREELRFPNTHPLTYKYIAENFERLPASPLPGYEIYRAKSANP